MDNEPGQRIKTAREAASLTQEELARRMGVSRDTVSRWERGKQLIRARNVEAAMKAIAGDKQVAGVARRTLAYLSGATAAILRQYKRRDGRPYLDDEGVGLASTSPQTMIPAIGQATEHSQAARDELTKVVSEMDEPWPATMTMEMQSQFWLGYYWQRAEMQEQSGE